MNTSASNVSFQAPFASVLGLQGYTAIVSVLLGVLVPPQVFLSVLTIIGLMAGKTFRKVKAQRNVMIAIASMGFVSPMIPICYGIAEYLFLSGQVQAGIVFCHGGTLFFHLNAGMRNCLLACLSVTVLIIIRYGNHKMRLLHINIALVAMCAAVFALGLVYFFPSAVNFEFQLDGVLCHLRVRSAGYAGIALALIFIDTPSRVVSIGVAIASLCIVKKYADLENKKLKVGLLKFTVLLVVLNVVVVLVNSTTLIPLFLFPSFEDRLDFASLVIFWQLTNFILPCIPSILTPLAMIGVFKPLRVAIKKILLPQGWCADSEEENEQAQGDKSQEDVLRENETESTVLDYRSLQS